MCYIRASLMLFLLIAVLYPIAVLSFCQLKFPNTPPILFRNFGSRRVIQTNPNGISLSVEEELEVYCSGSLVASWNRHWYSEDDKVQSATIRCSSKGLFFKNHAFSEYFEPQMEIGCDSWPLKLYESNSSLPNCEKYMSYGIGIKALEYTEKTTALCYDLDTFSIKYAKYLTYEPENNVIPEKKSFKEIPITSLDMELQHFDSLFSLITEEEIRERYRAKQSQNVLLQNQEFDFESLTQGNDYLNYNRMFKIIWWNNLRIGNWNFFMNALKERAHNVTYMVHTGVSGAVKMQSFENCNKTEILEFTINKKSTKAPGFIYTYLKSLEPNINEEFVVIAYNTPFFTINKDKPICEDMCNKVAWLNKSIFGKTHLMPVYGVVICCHPNEVVGKIDNFPYVVDKTTSTTQSPV